MNTSIRRANEINDNLKKKVYKKYISLLDDNLKEKTLKQLKNNIEKNRNINQNAQLYSIPPLRERAKAIINSGFTTDIEVAKTLASNPWFTPLFKNSKIMYLPDNVIPGMINTYPKNHNVYKLLPKYFPEPQRKKKSSTELWSKAKQYALYQSKKKVPKLPKPVLKISNKTFNTKTHITTEIFTQHKAYSTKKQMTWGDVLQDWDNGIVLKYPKHIEHTFLIKTSKINSINDKFMIEYEYSKRWKSFKQDYTDFNEIKSNRSVVSYKTNDVVFIIPKPSKSHEYSDMKMFIDNAPLSVQQSFWKEVARQIRKFIKMKKTVWITCNTKQIHYMHIRLSPRPDFYYRSKLK